MKPQPDALIGPAASVLQAARALARSTRPLALLLTGNPGVGKTAACDRLALELTRSPFAIEHVNGQSLGIDLVRAWRERGLYGNLFSDWTVKRVDELDLASPSAMAELLSFLDYQPDRVAILATTNDYGKLQSQGRGRLETRFVRYQVDAPSVAQTAALLARKYALHTPTALAIARGAVPDGCLESEGCNVRAAIKDAQGYAAARSTTRKGPRP